MKLKSIKSNLKKVDAHSIKSDAYEELPELTDEMFDHAVYKVGGVEKPMPRRCGKQKTSSSFALIMICI